MKPQNLTLKTYPLYVLATFHQDLDMDLMLALKPEIERLLPQIDKAILVDIERVNFLDSSAVGLLAMFFRHTQALDLPMMIIAAQPQPEAVLGMVGLTDHVSIYSTLEAAETALTACLKARE